jgi:uncharacterized protein (TIGR02284 family)
MKNHDEDEIKQLNSFLRGERAAVDTYDQALEKVEDVSVQSVLRDNRACHERRSEVLRLHIRELGGEPAEGSGAWGSFAKAVEGAAKLLGASAAIAALEEGEDHGLADYRRDMSALSATSRRIVAEQLLPAQIRTHEALAQVNSML